ncbi:hypothetical protein [Phyllobacterium chamaecytisi]|uniref:hypothetical protein n=1 Tax=Phyllobacterium chamaecytisi TaxID=2876082 RepID=UPI001CCC0AB4|nr:hypothetical protein [Phyllobacterium sp. KW56]MBZ9600765.1 hypothetical protein [Phyllobacterium sp. KW56]
MVNRIHISPGVFDVSRPGVDVLVASQVNLLFSADRGTPARFIRGSFSSSVGGGGGGSSDSRTIMFGKTFSVVPFVMTQWFEGTGASRPGNWVPQRGFGGGRTSYGDFAFNFVAINVDVYTDRIFLEIKNAGSPGFDYAVDYLVFDYRLGF